MRPNDHRAYRSLGDGERGAMTLFLAAVFVPLFFALFWVTFEMTNFFGLRDELQRVVDHEAHDALVYGKSLQEVEAALKRRMRAVGGITELDSISITNSVGGGSISVSGRYQGALGGLAEMLYGIDSSPVRLEVRSTVRVRPAAALILIDRSMVAAGRVCDDPELRAMTLFADRLAQSWERVGAQVSVAVTPGGSRPIERLTGDEHDGVTRCSEGASASFRRVNVVAGIEGINPFGATMVGYSGYELAGSELMNHLVDTRCLVFIVRRSSYDAGYAAELFSLVREAAASLDRPVHFYTLIIDESGSIDLRPMVSGINGGSYRELTVSRLDLLGFRLMSAAAQTITDRVSLER